MGSHRAALSGLTLFVDLLALHYRSVPEQGDQLVLRPEGAFAQVWRHDRLDRFELFGGIAARVNFRACQGGMPQPKRHLAVSNRSQPRPPFRAQSRPLWQLDRAVPGAAYGRREAVDKWPAGATVQSRAQAGHLSTADSVGVGQRS